MPWNKKWGSPWGPRERGGGECSNDDGFSRWANSQFRRRTPLVASDRTTEINVTAPATGLAGIGHEDHGEDHAGEKRPVSHDPARASEARSRAGVPRRLL